MSDIDSNSPHALLRAAFDASFAAPPVMQSVQREALLVVRVGDDEMALRVGEIAEIMRCPSLTRVPSRHVALRGLAGVRGALVAAYDVAALLGGRSAASTTGWLVLCGADRSVALFLDELIGHALAPPEAIVEARPTAGVTASEVVTLDGVARGVLSVPRILDIIFRGAAEREES